MAIKSSNILIGQEPTSNILIQMNFAIMQSHKKESYENAQKTIDWFKSTKLGVIRKYK